MLSSIEAAEETMNVSSIGRSKYNPEISYDMMDDSIALLPTEPFTEFIVDGMDLTGIGYVNDKLHIQIKNSTPNINDNHGYFYLVNVADEHIIYDDSYSFYTREDVSSIHYTEFVFDIPKGEINHYTLYGDFVTSSMHTKGKWSVTFPLEIAQ